MNNAEQIAAIAQSELVWDIFVQRNPALTLIDPKTHVQTDYTCATAPAHVVDTAGNTVYAVKSDAFQPGGAYSASDSDGILGKVDLSTGLVTPIVTGMMTPHGALSHVKLKDL